MKIYFEDGPLIPAKELEFAPNYILDAGIGYSSCENFLWSKFRTEPDAVVYTNFLEAISSTYGWNEDKKEHTIFLRENGCGKFKQLKFFTGRELRQSHNLSKMYQSGVFGFNNLRRE